MGLSCLMLFSCKSSLKIETLYTVGTYSNHRVDFVQVKTDKAVPTVTVDLVIDGVFVTTLPQSDYDYAVYDTTTNFVFLKEAYEKGKITKNDLKAIASKEADKDHFS